jgi:hypothetical protein
MLPFARMVTGRLCFSRTRRHASAAAAVWALVTLGAIRPARAQSPTVAGYTVPPTCPDRTWFDAELTRRVATNRAEAAAPATLQVDVRAVESGFVGTLHYTDSSSGQAIRTVRHQSCEQVVRALALIGAVLTEASARRQAAPATLAFDDAAASRAEPRPARTGAPRRVGQTQAPRTARPVPKEPAWRTHGRLGAGLGVASALAPDWLLTPRFALGLERQPVRSRFGYIVGVSFSYAQSGTLELERASAELTWTAARLEGCAQLGLTGHASLAGCAYAEVGELAGRSIEGVTQDQTHRRLWASPGLGVALGSTLVGPLSLELGLRGFRPLVRPRFYFNPPDGGAQRWLHEVPPVGASAEAALVTHFP